jgi:hypothetical protein
MCTKNIQNKLKSAKHNFDFSLSLVAWAILDAVFCDYPLFSSWILLECLSFEVSRSTASGIA